MRRLKRVKVVTAILLLSGLATGLSAQSVAADTNISPSLVITQLKVTSGNGQFVMLYNTTDTVLDMSKYQLEYFNSYDLTKATSSKLIALAGSLPPHGYYLVNDSQLMLCYQLTIDSVSLGFSSVAGLVQILALSQNSPGGYASPIVQDYVGWSKTVAVGAQTLPTNTNASLLRQPVDAQNFPSISSLGSGTWTTVQPDSTNACNFVTVSSPITKIVTVPGTLLPPSPPPAIILSSQVSEITMPPVNDGLMSPQITEILPNPIGTGNDNTDEFIEIYNSNSALFDLSGYSLQTGTSSFHNYVFPMTTTLPAQSYTVFNASRIGLSLSNAGGQVKILDPSGTPISSTGIYDTAKDGLAWALANGNWLWTNVPTPGTINVISQPAAAKTTLQPKTPVLSTTATSEKISNITNSKSTSTAPKALAVSSKSTPIHNWTLALVAAAAILYGVYEYRADLGNRIHQFRKYFRHRRADWLSFTWWRSHRTSQ